MLKKKKFIIIGIIIFTICLLCGTKSYATDGITYEKTYPSNDGTIIVNLKGLELDENETYEYALGTQGNDVPKNWYTISEKTKNTAVVNLGTSTEGIKQVLAKTDKGRIWIKKQNSDNSTAVKVDVDLTLPLEKAISISNDGLVDGKKANTYGNIYIQESYGLSDAMYKFEKINNNEIINAWLKYKNNNDNQIQDVYNTINKIKKIPETGYSKCYYNYGGAYKTILNSKFDDRTDGLYLIWIKLTDDGCKTITGYVLYDGLYDTGKTIAAYLDNVDEVEPTVSSIAVTSPKSGEYKTGEKITITATFSEDITGETMPTLKIKFGTSSERSVTNGTLSGNKITYTYNIQSSDVGQLAVTGFTGGTIKDASGNNAKITVKTLSGNTIKANVTSGSNNTPAPTNPTTPTPTPTPTTPSPKDPTVTPKTKLPQTGANLTIILVVSVIGVISILIYNKYKKFRTF